jgi:hypothetical protein
MPAPEPRQRSVAATPKSERTGERGNADRAAPARPAPAPRDAGAPKDTSDTSAKNGWYIRR